MSKSAEEVAQLRKELKKNWDMESKVLDILKVLRTQPMTRDILKVTGIGKTVNKLAQDDREAVRAAAKPILKSWKEASKKVSPPLEKNTPASTSTGSLFTSSQDETQAEGKGQSEAATKNKQGDDGQSGSDKKLVSTIAKIPLPSDPKRVRTCELFQQIFKSELTTYGRQAVVNVSAHIEKAMADALTADSAPYRAKYRSLKTNFGLNPALKHQLLDGTLTATRLVQMQDADLLSADRLETIDKEKQEVSDSMRQDWLDANREEIMKSMGVDLDGGMYTCGRCGSKKTHHYQKTRSADEPMTVFISCTECPNKWRQ